MAVPPIVRSVAAAAVDHANRRPEVSYVEVRWVQQDTERLRVRDGQPDGIRRASSSGFAVRLLADGAWGFACTPLTDAGALERSVAEAVAIARASAQVSPTQVSFPPRDGEVGTYATPVQLDPFGVPLERKLADLFAPEAELRRGARLIRSAEAWMEWQGVRKLLLTSEGSDLEQRFLYGGVGILAVAVGDDGCVQQRSYPAPPGAEFVQAGYEIVAEADLLGHAQRVRDEAVALIDAAPCPAATRDVILGSHQMAMQIHESCGHPSELDRALGTEVSLAGGSFLQPEHLGHLQYGSPIVTITADARAPRGLGTFGWDDEATPAGDVPLVQDGVFVDYLSSRETAARLGRESTGTVRADGWNRIPLIRMVNVSLAPRSGSLADLIADTADGIMLDTNKSWSIDDLRLHFQFSCELAWEIKRGKQVRLLRDARYAGVTPEFWNRCDAIAGPEEARIWGVAHCGKGDPMQGMQVAHGAPPARFRRVEVGHS